MRKQMGNRLRSLRGKKSRKEVAKAIGISVSTLQMYENGKRTPKDSIKIKLAQYYHVSVEKLFFSTRD
ncbi:helix-turn-helix transcriptional regulator [Kroppenstedtia pulmonis]|uniref:Helix-turn-helix transcriptional regulator n=2 Tax=Kroppenstedtia pulmonis TaxID=1380685 RepID=A0A7D3YC36_9BACL|nr:helix-turn-helix transcriptional regulator [Kroppenstedtia pulmonis]